MPKPKPKPKKSAAQLMKDINDEYPGSLKLASDESLQIRRVPTGILTFDNITGGGIALGRWYEIYGQESVLKSVLATCAASAFQDEFPERNVLWVDSEGSFDPDWVARFGVDMDRISVLSTPESGEFATAVMEEAMDTSEYSLIVLDSVAALMPQRETEYSPEETEKAVGASGRMTSAMGRRLTRLLKNDCTIIIINQLRENIGGFSFGDPAKPTGGRAIRYYAGQRIELKRGATVKEKRAVPTAGGKNETRNVLEARVINMRIEKDKIGSCEGREGTLLWRPREGMIDEEDALLTLGMEYGIVKRDAQTVTLFLNRKEQQGVRGWDNAKRMLSDDRKKRTMLKKLILRHVRN